MNAYRRSVSASSKSEASASSHPALTGLRLPGFSSSPLCLAATEHASGLSVTAIDGDRISPANCVRQPFSESEIGLFKSVVLINRLNLFWALKWEAVPQHVSKGYGIANDVDVVIGCVDTRQARATIHQSVTTTWCGTVYWLDLGNNPDSGQFILGQPLNRVNRRKAARLRTVSELFGEIVDSALDDENTAKLQRG